MKYVEVEDLQQIKSMVGYMEIKFVSQSLFREFEDFNMVLLRNKLYVFFFLGIILEWEELG